MLKIKRIKKKKILIILIVALIYIILAPVFAFVFPNIYEIYKEENTVNFTSTIEYINYNELKILSQKNSCILYIKNENSIINIDSFNELKVGNLINFRISKNLVKNFDELPIVEIVYLSTNDRVIFSFESINQNNTKSIKNNQIIAMVIEEIFLLILVYCIIKLTKIKKMGTD